MSNENQLEFVREQLGKTPPSEWGAVAESASLCRRTLYQVAKTDTKPSYDTVFSLYVFFKKRGAKRVKA